MHLKRARLPIPHYREYRARSNYLAHLLQAMVCQSSCDACWRFSTRSGSNLRTSYRNRPPGYRTGGVRPTGARSPWFSVEPQTET